MCKSSPFFYSFCVMILLSSLQLCSANNNWNSEQQNRNGTEQEQLSMVDAPKQTEASPTSELQMVDAPMQSPTTSSRIEREGILVDIADLGGGKQSNAPKKNVNEPKEEQ